MTVVNWVLNSSILLVCGALFYFFTPLLDSKVKKITIVNLLLLYSVLYFISCGFHIDIINPYTVHPNAMSTSLVGVLLLGIMTLVSDLIYFKYRKKN